jgi:hypothetical protein
MTADQVGRVDEWLRDVLWENVLPGAISDGSHGSPFEIHRLKGRLVMRDGGQKMIQGVREVFEIIDNPSAVAGESDPVEGKIVLIGRHLRDFDFQKSLLAAIRDV